MRGKKKLDKVEKEYLTVGCNKPKICSQFIEEVQHLFIISNHKLSVFFFYELSKMYIIKVKFFVLDLIIKMSVNCRIHSAETIQNILLKTKYDSSDGYQIKTYMLGNIENPKYKYFCLKYEKRIVIISSVCWISEDEIEIKYLISNPQKSYSKFLLLNIDVFIERLKKSYIGMKKILIKPINEKVRDYYIQCGFKPHNDDYLMMNI